MKSIKSKWKLFIFQWSLTHVSKCFFERIWLIIYKKFNVIVLTYWFCDLLKSSKETLFAHWTYPFYHSSKHYLFMCDETHLSIMIHFKYCLYCWTISFYIITAFIPISHNEISKLLGRERNNLQTIITYLLYVNKITIWQTWY